MAMSEASYISSGSKPVNEYAHYGLALDFYTHFTVCGTRVIEDE